MAYERRAPASCAWWGAGAYALARALKEANVITGGPCLDSKYDPTRARALGSLGSDDVEMTESQWRAQMLAEQKEQTAWQKRWVERDELQRWLQIGATLAIPLSAAIWKMIFRAGRKQSEGR